MRVARILIAAIAALSGMIFSAQATESFEQRVNSLIGVWLALEAGDGIPRVFRVTNIKHVRSAGAEVVAYYGFVAGGWTEPTELSVVPAGDRVRLDFVTGANSKVRLHLEPDDVMNGRLQTTSGKEISLRFARSSVPQIHAWIAENPIPRLKAGRDSVIELLYVSASDCVFCRGWEARYLELGIPKSSLDWADVRFTEVKKGSYRGGLGVRDVPEHLQSSLDRLIKSRGSLSIGTPWYALFVNNEVRCYTWGSGNFETLIQPAIKAALREKSSDRAAK